MHGCGSGLLDPVLENTLWKADPLVLVPSGTLLGRVDLSFMNSVTGSGFVAKCLNMIADLSFVNSATGSSFVAKCSNILQDKSIHDLIRPVVLIHWHLTRGAHYLSKISCIVHCIHGPLQCFQNAPWLFLHWQSLWQQYLQLCNSITPSLSCLGHLGRDDTDGIISTCLASPKVAKTSKEDDIESQYRQYFCQET